MHRSSRAAAQREISAPDQVRQRPDITGLLIRVVGASWEIVSISSLRLTCSALNAGQLSNTSSVQHWPDATGDCLYK